MPPAGPADQSSSMGRPMLSLYRRHRPRTFERWSARSTSSARSATRSSSTRSTTPTCSSARAAPARPRWPSCWPAPSTPRAGPAPTSTPRTPSCQAILAGTSLDVVEMDAASNNSVDDIRELRENVALAPMQGRRRVYILDEAHMLSTAAWNAFLKTLEEPPAHVVFVLATTEAHKVPATIVDRCHRFDFQRPSLEQIAGVLRRVAAEEGIEMPDAGRRHARPRGHRQLPRRARHARAARDLRRQGGQARGRARHPRRGRRRAGARRRPRRSPTHDPKAALLARAAAVGLGPRLHPVHARPLRAPAPPVRGPDARRGARLLLGHRRAHRPAGVAGRALLAGRDPARDRLPGRRHRGGQGRLGAAHPARDGAAEGHPAAGGPLAPGADVPDRAARAAAGGRRARAAGSRHRVRAEPAAPQAPATAPRAADGPPRGPLGRRWRSSRRPSRRPSPSAPWSSISSRPCGRRWPRR